jgi:hypothetical protein
MSHLTGENHVQAQNLSGDSRVTVWANLLHKRPNPADAAIAGIAHSHCELRPDQLLLNFFKPNVPQNAPLVPDTSNTASTAGQIAHPRLDEPPVNELVIPAAIQTEPSMEAQERCV